MDYEIIATLPGRPPARGILTTAHSQSSYGIPVVVVDGTAYGTAEVLWVDRTKIARKTAEKAGYTVYGTYLSDEGL